jgi:hypothetical protein
MIDWLLHLMFMECFQYLKNIMQLFILITTFGYKRQGLHFLQQLKWIGLHIGTIIKHK